MESDDLSDFLAKDVEEIEPSPVWGHVWTDTGVRGWTPEEVARILANQCPFHGDSPCACHTVTLDEQQVRDIVTTSEMEEQMAGTYTVYFNDEDLSEIRQALAKLEDDALARAPHISAQSRDAMMARLGVIGAGIKMLGEPVAEGLC